MSSFSNMPREEVERHYRISKKQAERYRLWLVSLSDSDDSNIKLDFLFKYEGWLDRALAANYELLRRWEPVRKMG